MTLHCELPGNDFPLHDDERPAVLIAGGIGITPIKAMAQKLCADGRHFELHYAVRSRAEAAYVDDLECKLGAALHVYSADRRHRLDLAQLMKQVAVGAVFYVCGSGRLIDATRHAARSARDCRRPDTLRTLCARAGCGFQSCRDRDPQTQWEAHRCGCRAEHSRCRPRCRRRSTVRLPQRHLRDLSRQGAGWRAGAPRCSPQRRGAKPRQLDVHLRIPCQRRGADSGPVKRPALAHFHVSNTRQQLSQPRRSPCPTSTSSFAESLRKRLRHLRRSASPTSPPKYSRRSASLRQSPLNSSRHRVGS